MQEVKMAETIRVGDLKERRFTLTQAAQILRVEPDLIRKKIDRGLLVKSYIQQQGRKLRVVDGIDIVFLLVSDGIAPKVRSLVYAQLKQQSESDYLSGSMAVEVKVGSGEHTVDVSLDRPIRDAIAGINALQQTKASVDHDGTISNKGVKAHKIAALIEGGTSLEDLLRDYPNLTEAEVKSSVAFAKANPKQGRPFPTRTVKSALRNGRGGLQQAFAAARSRK
jgi:hypothetical protein